LDLAYMLLHRYVWYGKPLVINRCAEQSEKRRVA